MSDFERHPRIPPQAYLSSSSGFLELLEDAKWRTALLRDALARADSPLTSEAINILHVLNMMSPSPTCDIEEM